MRIQHNIMAMNAYRNYGNNTSALSANLEKLSSGYKINRAGDDAAGLAISEKMRAQITGLEQAGDNVKDGISLVKTAEGALQEVQDMLNRMVELATQSANGTYEDTVDRKNLQAEVDQLTTEINRIADSSNFNGINLLDGSLSTGTILADYTSLDSTKIQTLMLGESSTNAVTDVGKATILETDATNTQTPSFKVSFDGVSHIITAAGNNDITLTIDGQDTKITEGTELTGAGGTAFTGADLAQAFADKIGAQFTDSNNEKWDVSVEGNNLVFTYAEDIDDAVNKHFDVSLTGVDGAKQPATGGTTSYAYTAGVLGTTGQNDTNDLKVTATVTLANGDSIEFEVGSQSYAVGATALKTALQGATAQYNNNTVNLTDYFTVDENAGTITLTDKTTGATGSGNKVTLAVDAGTSTVGTGGNPVAPSFGTVQNTAGKNAYSDGTTGYLNAATEVNISIDKVPGDQLASTTLNLKGYLTDGAKITLGDQTYTIALGEDSAFKDATNAVYLSDAAATDEQIASKLTEVAANNKTFSVGHAAGSDGKITLKQLSSAKGTTDMSTMEKFASYIGISTVDTSETTPSVGNALTLQIGDTSASYNQMSVDIKDMHASAIGSYDENGKFTSIEDISIATAEDAQAAISVIKDAINSVSSTRGDLGAIQNRLEHTSNNLSVMAENIQDAESTIRDTDIAEEMMSYTKNNILVQSAQAMLAQANQVPQGVLQLLQ